MMREESIALAEIMAAYKICSAALLGCIDESPLVS